MGFLQTLLGIEPVMSKSDIKRSMIQQMEIEQTDTQEGPQGEPNIQYPIHVHFNLSQEGQVHINLKWGSNNEVDAKIVATLLHGINTGKYVQTVQDILTQAATQNIRAKYFVEQVDKHYRQCQLENFSDDAPVIPPYEVMPRLTGGAGRSDG